MIIFAAQDILSSSHCKLGHLLLCCIRYYIEFDVYASFEVHTEETITAGRLALQKFSEIMDVSRYLFRWWLSDILLGIHHWIAAWNDEELEFSKEAFNLACIRWYFGPATTVPSPMKKCTALFEKSTFNAQISRMSLLRWVTSNYIVMWIQPNDSFIVADPSLWWMASDLDVYAHRTRRTRWV